MAKNTIVMWGQGRKSADTQRKLQVYDRYRNMPYDSATRSKLYNDTVIFGKPIREINPETGETKYEYLGDIAFQTDNPPPHNRASSWTTDVNSPSAIYNDLNTTRKLEVNYKYHNSESPYDKLYDYIPYVDTAVLSSYKRPSSFYQCVAFFFPLTAGNDIPIGSSALHSTSPLAYDLDYSGTSDAATSHKGFKKRIHQSVTDVFGSRQFGRTYSMSRNPYSSTSTPVDLGNVTMMYAWFVMYKLLLCPRAYTGIQLPSRNGSNLFTASTEEKFRFGNAESSRMSNVIGDVKKRFGEYRNSLALATKVASAASQSKDFNFETALAQLQDRAEGYISNVLEEGFTNLVNKISSQLGSTIGTATAVLSTALGDTITPQKLASISIDDASVITAGIQTATAVAENLGFSFNALPENDRRYLIARTMFGEKLSRAEISKYLNDNYTKDSVKNLLRNYTQGSQSRLSKDGSKLLDAITSAQKAEANRKKVFSFADTKRSLNAMRARENGVGAATLGVKALSTGFNMYLNHREKEISQSLSRLDDYYRTRFSRLRLDLSEDGIDFVLDTDAASSGVKSSDKDSWEIKPYCGPVNGRYFKEYITEVYKQFYPLFSEIKSWYSSQQTMKGFDLIAKLKRLSGNSLSVKELIDMPKNQGYCRTFDLFEQDHVPIKSTRWVLWDLQAYSPFTQAYGFEPTFLTTNPSMTSTEGRQELNSHKPYSRRNYEVGIFGSPYNKGKTFSDASNGNWFIPGRPHIWSRVTSWDTSKKRTGSHAWWKTSSLQQLNNKFRGSGKNADRSHKRTVNSQRKLSSAHPNGQGGFTDLDFDVATGVPIFNSQWSAAVSVMLCYAEALENLSDMGYGWATPLVAERDRNLAAEKAAFQAMKSIQLPTQGGAPFRGFKLLPTPLTSIPFFDKKNVASTLLNLNKGNKGTSSEVAADKEKADTPFIFKPSDDKPEKKQDATQLAVQLGVTTASLGLLAILALKLRRLK